MRLGLVGVGPQRTATTWLYECLRTHPRLGFPAGVKETFFLDERFENGWGWYWSHFRQCGAARMPAEIGASYFDVPEVVERLWAHNPRCRVIVTLRDPAARSFSLYLHHWRKGRLKEDFGLAVRDMPKILQASHYRIHLERWRRRFAPDRLLVVLAEDIERTPEGVLERVYATAGIAAVAPPAPTRERVNVASRPAYPGLAKVVSRASEWLTERGVYGPLKIARRLGLRRVYGGGREPLPTLDGDTRGALIRRFEGDIGYVEELLGRRLPEWRRVS